MVGRRSLLRAAMALPILPALPSFAGGRQEDVVVALAGPMTGEAAYSGQLMREAASVACDYINERGGISGRRLAFSVEDDAGDPAQAVSVANRIAAKRIPLVIGHTTGATALPAAQVYRENGIFLLAPVSPDNFTRPSSPYILRLVPPNHFFEAHLFDEIAKSGPARVAIIHNKVEYGRGVAELLRDDLRTIGWPEPLFEGVNNGDKDFYSLVEKLREWRADTVVLALYPVEAGLILRQAAERKLPDIRFMGHGMLVTPAFTSTAGTAVNGALVVATRGCDPVVLEKEMQRDEMALDVARAFLKRGMDPYGVLPYPMMFSAFQIAAEALSVAGTGSVEALAAALHGRNFHTVRGTMSFAGDGELADADCIMALYEMTESGPRLVKYYGQKPA